MIVHDRDTKTCLKSITKIMFLKRDDIDLVKM